MAFDFDGRRWASGPQRVLRLDTSGCRVCAESPHFPRAGMGGDVRDNPVCGVLHDQCWRR